MATHNINNKRMSDIARKYNLVQKKSSDDRVGLGDFGSSSKTSIPDISHKIKSTEKSMDDLLTTKLTLDSDPFST